VRERADVQREAGPSQHRCAQVPGEV
jgi:hypothetical protein